MEKGSHNSAPRVYLTRQFPEPVQSILNPHFNLVMNNEKTPVKRDELMEQIHEVDGLLCTLNDKIDKEIMNNASNLKVVSTFSVGYEHIDIRTATVKGIYVTNTPDVLTAATADLTIALMLSVSRRIVDGHNLVNDRQWNKPWDPSFMIGSDLNNKTIGIIGFGRIGRAVARRAKAFGMRIRYYSRSKASNQVEMQLGAEYLTLERLLAESDYVTIHTPLNEMTHHLINSERIGLMKRTAFLINTSRGGIINEDALAHALMNDEIAGAGLDVFETEPLGESSPLLKVENLVMTPHIGSATSGTRYQMGELSASNLRNVLFGIEPLSLVNNDVRVVRPLNERKNIQNS